ALLVPAADGFWTVEARLLYDLQKVCVDHERAVYKVDLVEWALSLGRRPVKRFLTGQREVLIFQHLRSASRRLILSRLPDAARSGLAALLHQALGESEEKLRAKFRPLIESTLEEVGLRPKNVPEQVARDKLVEELLDRIAEHGLLNIGDLRDAVSRNNLKL